MVEATVQLGGDITKERKNRGVEKRLTRELKEMYGEENIISAVIHVDLAQRSICIVISSRWTAGEFDRRKTIGDKRKCAGTQEKFLKLMQRKGASR